VKQMRNAFCATTQRVVVIPSDVSGQPICPIFKGQESLPPKKKPVTLVRDLYREDCRQ
jgi:hypothetical protein